MTRKGDAAQIQRALGARVRRLRRVLGLTQEEAADRAGIDYKRWQRIESGEINCTVRTLARVADALGVSFWRLVREPRRR